MFEKRRRSRSTRERVVHSLPCGARANAPLHTHHQNSARGKRTTLHATHSFVGGSNSNTHTTQRTQTPFVREVESAPSCARTMADVIQTAPSVLSPISPNENRKRRHGYGDATGGDGCGGSWFKRHRTGSSFARRLLHLRGFSVDVRQAEELVRFIDQLPQEMDKVRAFFFSFCRLSPFLFFPSPAPPPFLFFF